MYEALVKRLRELPPESFTFEIMGVMHEAADAIEELNKDLDFQIRAARADVESVKPRWIPVTERLPEDLQNVLVINDGRVDIGHCEHFYGDEQIFVEWHDTLYYPIDPPCWMPLPALPAVDTEEQPRGYDNV